MVNRLGSCPKYTSSNLVSYKQYCMVKKNNVLNNSSNVSTSVLNYSLLAFNNLKSILPLNLPRVNKNYLFGLSKVHWLFLLVLLICVIDQVSGVSTTELAGYNLDQSITRSQSMEKIREDVQSILASDNSLTRTQVFTKVFRIHADEISCLTNIGSYHIITDTMLDSSNYNFYTQEHYPDIGDYTFEKFVLEELSFTDSQLAQFNEWFAEQCSDFANKHPKTG